MTTFKGNIETNETLKKKKVKKQEYFVLVFMAALLPSSKNKMTTFTVRRIPSRLTTSYEPRMEPGKRDFRRYYYDCNEDIKTTTTTIEMKKMMMMMLELRLYIDFMIIRIYRF